MVQLFTNNRIDFPATDAPFSTPTSADIITIIVLVSITIFVYNRKSVKNGFTGTIYTINYCDGKDHCDKMITIGEKIPNSIKQYKSPETAIKNFNNKEMYYKHIIKNDIVKESYVEFIIDNNMVSLKGADSSYYEHNKNVLLRTFDSNNCIIRDTNIHCSAYGLYANAFQNGYVEVGYSYWNCYVSEKGNSLCSFGK